MHRSSFFRRHRAGRRVLRGLFVIVPAMLTGACSDGSTSPTTLDRFAVQVSGETFVVMVSADEVAGFEARLASGETGVVSGTLAPGDGGYNAPWGWHMVPASVHTADLAVEVCDGRPSMVEADLDYWLDTVGAFCPWGATVVARLDEPGG